jgi:hypothetical protein
MSITQAAASTPLVVGPVDISIVIASANASDTAPNLHNCALIVFNALSFLLLLQFINRLSSVFCQSTNEFMKQCKFFEYRTDFFIILLPNSFRMAGQLLFAVGVVLGFAARAGRNQIITTHKQHQTAQALCF